MISDRLRAAAAILGADADTLIAKLDTVADGYRDAIATTDAAMTSFAVATDLPADAWTARRMANVAVGISGSTALTRAAVAVTGSPRVERAIGSGGFAAIGPAGVSATLAFAHEVALADQLAAVEAIGFATTIAGALARRVRRFADEDRRARTLRVTIFSGDPGGDAAIELGVEPTSPDLSRSLADVGIEVARVRLVQHIDLIPSEVRCSARLGAIGGVAIVYRDPPAELCRQVIDLIAPATGDNLADFVAACGSDRVARLELEVGARDAITARFGVAVSPY